MSIISFWRKITPRPTRRKTPPHIGSNVWFASGLHLLYAAAYASSSSPTAGTSSPTDTAAAAVSCSSSCSVGTMFCTTLELLQLLPRLLPLPLLLLSSYEHVIHIYSYMYLYTGVLRFIYSNTYTQTHILLCATDRIVV
jgi:hypothetical protein